MNDEVRVFAPASVSNLNCGFDILGFAVEGPGDTVRVRRCERPGVFLTAIEGDGGQLPRAPERNTASVAVARLLSEIDRPDLGLEVELHKGMPLRSGLGSSAASGVAAVVAATALLELELPQEVLLRCAVEGERVACGSAHADNAAPSLYGGLVLVRAVEKPAVVELPVPEPLSCAVVRLPVEVDTGAARALLGDSVALHDAVRQWGNVAAFVAGLCRADPELIGSALVDVIAEPVRLAQVPHLPEARRAALEAGALGCGLSGSGPSIFALCWTLETARRAARAMAERLREVSGLEPETLVSPVGAEGARILADREPA